MAKIFEAKYFQGNTLDSINSNTATNTGSVTLNKGEKGQYLNLANGKYLTYANGVLPASGPISVIAFAKCGIGSVFGTNHMAVLSDTTAGTARAFSIGMNTAVNRANIDMASPNYRTFIWNQDYKWHCFVFTLPGSDTTSISSSAFYVDGVSQAVSTTAAGALTTRANTKIVGGTSTGGVGKGADVAYLAVHDTVLTQSEIDAYVAQFNRLIGQDKPKRGFLINKPTDLSNEVNNTVGSELGTALNTWNKSGTIVDVGNGVSFAPSPGNYVYKTVGTAGRRYLLMINASSTVAGDTIRVYHGATTIATTFTLTTTQTTYSAIVYDPPASSSTMYIQGTAGSGVVTVYMVTIKEYSGLVAAYNMKPNGLTLTDISGNGYNGTLGDNIVSTQDGLMASGSINGLLIRDGAIITTNDHSIIGRIKLNTLMSGDGVLFTNDNSTANTIVDSLGISNGQIVWNYDASGTYKNGSTRTLAVGRWYDFALTLSGGRTGTVKLYIDGVEDTITTTSYYRSGADVKLFNRSGGSVPFYGECADLRIYNRALSLQEVKDYHNSFAKQPYLVEDFSDLPADGNAVVPREWTKISGSFKGGEITLTQGNLIPNGYFESGITGVGVTSGTGGNATLSHETASPITGVGSLRITQTTQPSEAFRPHITIALTKTTEIDKTYSVRFKSRLLSGAVKFSAGNGVQLGLASSQAYLVNQVFSGTQQWSVTVKSTAVGTNMFLYFNGSLSAFDLLLDDIEVVEIDPLQTLTKGSKYLECVTGGYLNIPSKQAYGIWEFDFYKGADASQLVIWLMSDKIITKTPNGDSVNGYHLWLYTDEKIYLQRDSGGTYVTLNSSSWTFNNNTWYRIKVTRSTSGVFTVLIKGGGLTPTAGYDGWYLAFTAVTDTIIASSNYLGLYLGGAGDRIANIKLTNGVTQ